jgi:hypothetical protein
VPSLAASSLERQSFGTRAVEVRRSFIAGEGAGLVCWRLFNKTLLLFMAKVREELQSQVNAVAGYCSRRLMRRGDNRVNR